MKDERLRTALNAIVRQMIKEEKSEKKCANAWDDGGSRMQFRMADMIGAWAREIKRELERNEK